MKRLKFLALVALLVSMSCSDDDQGGGPIDQSGVFKGAEVNVYDGKAWTWVELNTKGEPEKVAISIDQDALNSMPSGDGQSPGGHDHHNNLVLPFDAKAEASLFKHVWLNWNPNGHPPAEIYGLPHFDMHFYMVDKAERETYTDAGKLDKSLEADYLPANYTGVDPVPAMGKHYVDTTSPEFNGQVFTQTFIHGSYDSKLVFLEPMITLEFLKKTTSFKRSLPQPSKYQKSGFYPTTMRVEKAGQVIQIILEDMVYKTAS